MKLLIDTHALIWHVGATRAKPWPGPPDTHWARNGKGSARLGDVLGLTHPGYELSPLRGCETPSSPRPG